MAGAVVPIRFFVALLKQPGSIKFPNGVKDVGFLLPLMW